MRNYIKLGPSDHQQAQSKINTEHSGNESGLGTDATVT